MTRERKWLTVQFGFLSILMASARPAPLNPLGVWILSGVLLVGLLALTYGQFLSVPYRRVRESLTPERRKFVGVLNAVVGVFLLAGLMALAMTGNHTNARSFVAVAWVSLFCSLMISNGMSPTDTRPESTR